MAEISDRELAELRTKAEKHDDALWIAKLAVKGTTVVVVVIIGVIFAWKAVSPQLNLYRANTEKQAVIADQRAQSEAAEFAAKSAVTQAKAKAEAMIIEAQGLAESQQIIAATLTPEYIRYLYIKALEGNPNQVIYVPTEAGLPILEAGRSGNTTVTP